MTLLAKLKKEKSPAGGGHVPPWIPEILTILVLLTIHRLMRKSERPPVSTKVAISSMVLRIGRSKKSTVFKRPLIKPFMLSLSKLTLKQASLRDCTLSSVTKHICLKSLLSLERTSAMST